MFAGLAFCLHVGSRKAPTAVATVDITSRCSKAAARDVLNAEATIPVATALPCEVEMRHDCRRTSTSSTFTILGLCQ